ncbi:uncharacterized protein L969DRAFT_85613 [Mixia osmundae IAM 14324]|uniref:Helicase C-terminal domain-containing protein n=1 Tax=Mixia osmundae (strain CBS 9802 / IAM 14324 / JCM 22182 / KY 12970) TaxID=764103 RepID=G7E6D1_MIXOS|nr:uncharacterized protein L969DRAFT_85613 [Mixia osmundae IAM 14324]KEI40452.1 hypothetical protein L969DRAFT_85613 [Mixia osmundae IAM 14324]GAA98391.1 hypothetical protein E5Q_05077 [Mixia osmundae IAM 14324]
MYKPVYLSKDDFQNSYRYTLDRIHKLLCARLRIFASTDSGAVMCRSWAKRLKLDPVMLHDYAQRWVALVLPDIRQADCSPSPLDPSQISTREILEGRLGHGFDLECLRDLLDNNTTASEDTETLDVIIFRTFLPWAAAQEPVVRKADAFTPAMQAARARGEDIAMPSPSELMPSRLSQLAKIFDQRDALLDRSARAIPRTIHVHVGPTNSGKTHNALRALADSDNGAYAGPLRMLAHEVFHRFNSGDIKGKRGQSLQCNLITGEDIRQVSPEAGLVSCTIEMVPIKKLMDVTVIDEIQLMALHDRGAAWTGALINLQARNVHVCGEPSAVGLIYKIARQCGDNVVLHEYDRLSPLTLSKKALGSLKQLERGDCLVAFSRKRIFQLKRDIERDTNLRVAVAYGGLPPEVRTSQAKSFNDGEVDIMIGSDALGMGLNLHVRRMIFSAMEKWDGERAIPLNVPLTKQIAGRAGRYGKQFLVEGRPVDPPEKSQGFVTTLRSDDLPFLETAINAPARRLHVAIWGPGGKHVDRLKLLFPEDHDTAELEQLTLDLTLFRPHLSTPRKAPGNLKMLDNVDTSLLTPRERRVCLLAPVPKRRAEDAFRIFVTSVANVRTLLVRDYIAQSGLQDALAEIFELLSVDCSDSSRPVFDVAKTVGLTASDIRTVMNSDNTVIMENLHACLTLYLWLSLRLPLVFADRLTANSYRNMIEQILQWGLLALRKSNVTELDLAALPRLEKRFAKRSELMNTPSMARSGAVTAQA